MAKREFIGDPIDATMQSIKESRYWGGGETVGGSTEDDKGGEMTEALPSFIDRDEYERDELRMLEKKILYPRVELKDLAERFDFTYSTLSDFLNRFRSKHEAQLREIDLYADLFPPSRRPDETGGEPSAEQAAYHKAREYFLEHPEADTDTARQELDIDDLTVTQLASAKGNAKQDLNRQQDDAGADELVENDVKEGDEAGVGDSRKPVPVDVAVRLHDMAMSISNQAVDMTHGEQVALVVDELERLRRAGEPADASDDAAMAELDRDTLFTIVTGGELSEQDRREIFELVVDDG